MNQADQYIHRLYKRMVKRLNREEVKTVAFLVGLDHNELPNIGKSGLVRELLVAVIQKRRLAALVAILQAEYGEGAWEGVPSWFAYEGVGWVEGGGGVKEERGLKGEEKMAGGVVGQVVAFSIFVLSLLWIVVEGVAAEPLITLVGSLGGLLALKGGVTGESLFDGVSFWIKRRYFHFVYEWLRFVDVKGLTTQNVYTLNLEQVFVELGVAPERVGRVPANPIEQLPVALQAGTHPIWRYLAATARSNQNLVVIGPPGSGKTTLLKNVALVLTNKKRRKEVGLTNKIPIFLFLRDQWPMIEADGEANLPEMITAVMKKWDVDVPAYWLRRQLKRGNCLVLLDGLDEVAEAQSRQRVVGWVEKQMVAYAKSQFVVSSRPHGYRENPLQGVTQLAVRPFNQRQIAQFVTNWYRANELMSAGEDSLGVRMRAEEGATDLLQRLRNSPNLADLAINPLLLTMIATVHRYSSSLPGRRVELYDEICDVFLGKRQKAKGLDLDLTPGQKRVILQSLAYEMMSRGVRKIDKEGAVGGIAERLKRVAPTITPERFLKVVEEESGLLVESEVGEYQFAHLTFQEYLTAVYIEENGLVARLREGVESSWWQETIRLYVALGVGDEIINACLDVDSVATLALAIECREEAREVGGAVRERLDRVIGAGLESENEARFRVVAEALLQLRFKRMVRLDDERFIDASLITQAEYQLFLDEVEDSKRYRPFHWEAGRERFAPGMGDKPMVGVSYAQVAAFCDWLGRRLGDGWQYRVPYSEEIAGEVLALVESEKGIWVREKGTDVVGFYGGGDGVVGVLDLVAFRWDGAYVEDFKLGFGGGLARNLVRNLARNLTRNQALDLARDQARDLARDLARDIDRDIDRDRDLDQTRDLARDLARDIDRARDLDQALDQDRDIDHALDIVLDRARAQALDLALDIDRTRALVLVIILSIVFNLGFSFQLHQLGKVRVIDTILIDWPNDLLSSFQYLIASAIRQVEEKMKERPLIRRGEIKVYWDEMEGYRQFLVESLVVLEEVVKRRKGEAAGVEGILVVREWVGVGEGEDL